MKNEALIKDQLMIKTCLSAYICYTLLICERKRMEKTKESMVKSCHVDYIICTGVGRRRRRRRRKEERENHPSHWFTFDFYLIIEQSVDGKITFLFLAKKKATENERKEAKQQARTIASITSEITSVLQH